MKSILLLSVCLATITTNAQHNGTSGDMRNFAMQTQVVLARNPFNQKNNTVGTQYLFPLWVKGNLVTNDGKSFSYLYNFDKIDQRVYRLQEDSTIFLIDKDQVKSLLLSDGGTEYDFEKIPSLQDGGLYRVLVKAAKYRLYSFTKTKFIASNYTTNGISSSGNTYDEFKDAVSYYVVMADGSTKEIELKKKSIYSIFPEEKIKIDQFFKEHSNRVDEIFLKSLVAALNA